MFNFLKGPKNLHLELSRMLWAASVVSAIGFTGAHLYLNHEFRILDFAGGMGILLAGGGASTAIKDIGVAKANATSEATP